MRIKLIIIIFFFGFMALPALAEKKIAVVPFQVLSENRNLDFLGIGTADTLTHALSNIPSLVMIDRSQLQAVLNEQALQSTGFVDEKNQKKLGKLLGADILVVGTIQTSGNRYRLNARFTEVKTGKVLKSSQVTGTDIFELQDQLALNFINYQNININEAQREIISKITKATSNQTAYDYYIKGRTAYLLYTPQGTREAIEWYEKALSTDPKYTLALAAKAEAYALWASYLKFNHNDYQDKITLAEQAAREALAIEPRLGANHRAMAVVYTDQKKFDEAISSAQRAIELNPNDADAYLWLWMATAGKKQAKNDTAHLDPEHPLLLKALELNPHSSLAHAIRGIAYTFQRDFDKAALAYQEALKYSPKLAFVHNGLGMLYLLQGKLDQGIEAIKKSILYNPNDAQQYINLASAYFFKKDYEEAIHYYQQAIAINPEPTYYLSLGSAYMFAGDNSRALEQFQIVLQKNPDTAQAYLLSGRVYERNNDLITAMQYYQKALAINSKDEDTLKATGDIFRKQGKYQDALQKYREVLAINPQNAFVFQEMAKVYNLQNQSAEALNYYQKANKLRPQDQEIKNELAETLLRLAFAQQQQGNYEPAIDYYQQINALDIEDARVHNNLAIIYYSQNKLEAAISEYQRALNLKPEATTFFNLGIAYQQSGDWQQARSQYQRACALGLQSACTQLTK